MLDARVHWIGVAMTLAQQVGQMAQAEVNSMTADEARKYGIGFGQRRAARESRRLPKSNRDMLPRKRDTTPLVAGKNATSLPNPHQRGEPSRPVARDRRSPVSGGV